MFCASASSLLQCQVAGEVWSAERRQTHEQTSGAQSNGRTSERDEENENVITTQTALQGVS